MRSGTSGLGAGLARDERGKQSERNGAQAERVERSPSVVARLEDRVDAEHQGAGDQDGPQRIGSLPETDPSVAGDQPDRQQRGRHADRHVDEEDPVPADRLGQDAAREQPDRCAGGGDEAVDADRLGLLAGLGEHHHDHAQDPRRGQRTAHTLDEARSDQQPLAVGQAAEERGHGEHPQARQEDSPAPDEVAQAAREQQQAAEGDQVGVHHPGEARLREAQVALDRRQRDVHDGGVQDDHEHADAEHDERQPAVAIAARRLRAGGVARGCDSRGHRSSSGSTSAGTAPDRPGVAATARGRRLPARRSESWWTYCATSAVSRRRVRRASGERDARVLRVSCIFVSLVAERYTMGAVP